MAKKAGDVVVGHSIHDDKRRSWVLLTDPEPRFGYVVAQNLAAKRPFAHILEVDKVTLTGERREDYHKWKQRS